MKSKLLISFFVLWGLSYSLNTHALEIPDRSFSDEEPNPENFPTTGFSFSSCSSRIPIKKNKNPWIRVEKKKTKPAAMNPDPPSWVESYYVTPTNKTKAFSIINQEDSVYNSPTTLARIDCKNGLIYFQHFVREPIPTNYYRVFDLMTGAEYKVTEGAVTFSPDGKYMMTASAAVQDLKCGRSSTCEVRLKFYTCGARKKSHAECQSEKEFNYMATSKSSGGASFSPVPVKWVERRIQKKKELKVILGGSKRSSAKITCEVVPQLQCKISNAAKLSFQAGIAPK